MVSAFFKITTEWLEMMSDLHKRTEWLEMMSDFHKRTKWLEMMSDFQKNDRKKVTRIGIVHKWTITTTTTTCITNIHFSCLLSFFY